MRILFVIKSLTLPGGGAEKVLSEIASALADRGHDVVVASFDRKGTSEFYPFGARVNRQRLGVGEASARSRVFDFLQKIRSLRAFLKRTSPDVAIGFMHSAFVPLGLAALGTRYPVVASEHTAVEHYRSRPLQFRLVRWSARGVARMTVPSEKIRAEFPAGIREKMIVIPNPVAAMDKGRRGSRKAGRTLLAVGAFREEKGHPVLLSAFARLAPRFPDWTLRLVGDGPCRAALERQVAELGLTGRVIFAGAVADVAAEYASADLFAMPSAYESFGLATAEALAYALPAVGFADCPGTNELIADDVNGLLVSGEDRAGALAEGLAKLIDDGALRRRLGAKGPASVERFSLESVARAWEMLIQTVTDPQRLPDR